MWSSEGTSVSSNSFSRWTSHDKFLFKYHFVLHILCFLFFFSNNTMADVASKQHTTALILSTILTRTRRHTELTKNWQTWWETCAVPENIQFSFSFRFFTQINWQFNLECMGPFKNIAHKIDRSIFVALCRLLCYALLVLTAIRIHFSEHGACNNILQNEELKSINN